MSMTVNELRSFLIGSRESDSHLTTLLTSNKPQFGCNQVVIVRDQSQKETVPTYLKSMLCLTVYEAKGLEFDDVILFNFFNSGEILPQHWKFIN